MPAVPKRKKLLTKPTTGKADEIVLCEFATLACRLGYESEPIHSLIQRSADRKIACSDIPKARKPDSYKYDEAMFEDYVGGTDSESVLRGSANNGRAGERCGQGGLF